MLGLEALQQRRQRQQVHESVEESHVNERIRVQPIHCSSQPCTLACIRRTALRADPRQNILLPNPISSGVKEPHCTTLQMVCSSSSQNKSTARSTSRVKRGRRSMYDRTLEGLNGSGGRAAGVAMFRDSSQVPGMSVVSCSRQSIICTAS